MATVKDLLAGKGSGVLTIGRDATVLEAATVMNDHKVGAVVVAEEARIGGGFTERDGLRRGGGEGGRRSDDGRGGLLHTGDNRGGGSRGDEEPADSAPSGGE